MRIYNLAALEQLKVAKNKPYKDPMLYPEKNLWIHENSKEMKELGLMKGTFYDYRRSSVNDASSST